MIVNSPAIDHRASVTAPRPDRHQHERRGGSDKRAHADAVEVHPQRRHHHHAPEQPEPEHRQQRHPDEEADSGDRHVQPHPSLSTEVGRNSRSRPRPFDAQPPIFLTGPRRCAQPRKRTIASAVASKSSQRTLWPPGTRTCAMLPMRGTRFVIQERSPETTSVGQRGHGGACAAISLQATITAAGDHCQRSRPSGPSTRCSRASSSRISRGVEKSEPSAEARVDRLVGAREGDVGPRAVGALARDLGLDVHGGVEQDGALDAVGIAGRELRDQLAAEAVTDPGRRRRSRARRRSRRGRRRAARRSTAAPSPSGRARGSRPRSRGTRRGAPRPAGGTGGRGPVTPCRQTTGSPAGSPHSVTLSCT